MQQVDDPPSLPVGTEVSAKYKGAFCEAKVRKVVRNIKVKVAYKQGLGSGIVPDDAIKSGVLRVGAVVEVKHPDRRENVEATITKIQDGSQYTVVFDDGDITTLRRTALCLKSGRHFNESETLDQLPLTHPEHFGNPVIGGRRGGRRSRHLHDDSSDEEDEPIRKGKAPANEKEEHIGKVVCVESNETKKKDKDKWFPGLVVAPTAQVTVKIRVKDEYLVRSFKDGRYYTVPKKEAMEFTREMASKQDGPAVQAALEYLDNENNLPPHWDRDALFGLSNSSTDYEGELDSDSSDDEPREEKDHFVAQLYKHMDDRGTPLNKVPSIQNRDVDFYRLFRAVQKLGGYNRVTSQNQWKSITIRLGFTPITVSVTNLVKQAYKKFLQPYEDFHRKLGCSMIMTPRNASRSKGRSLVRANSVASPKPEVKELPQTITTPIPTATPATVATKITSLAADESENTSESSIDIIKTKRKISINSNKVKALIDKYEEKIKDEINVTVQIPAEPLNTKSTTVIAKEKLKESKEIQIEEPPVVPTPPPPQIPRIGHVTIPIPPPLAQQQQSSTLQQSQQQQGPGPLSVKKERFTKSGRPEEKRGRKKKEIVEPTIVIEKPLEKTNSDSIITVPVDFPVEVGDKLKVYYHEKTVTYEAKVIEISIQKGKPLYLVHYTGWNNRYDEWVPKERIAENLTNNRSSKKSKISQGTQPKSLIDTPTKSTGPPTSTLPPTVIKAMTVSKRGRGRSDSQPPRSTTPSSVASNSSRTKSPATPATQRRITRTQPNQSRRTSNNISDISMQTDSDSDSDAPVIRKQTRSIQQTPTNQHNKGPPPFKTSSNTSPNSETEEDDSAKGRDYDLNQIRSELKGFKELKSPSPEPDTPTSGTTKKTEKFFEYPGKLENKSDLKKITEKSSSVNRNIESKSSTDLSSDTDSFADDDSQSSDKTTQLENMTEKLQQKIKAEKIAQNKFNSISGGSGVGLKNPSAIDIISPLTAAGVEKIIKDSLAEKRQETLKASKPFLIEKSIFKTSTSTTVQPTPPAITTAFDKHDEKPIVKLEIPIQGNQLTTRKNSIDKKNLPILTEANLKKMPQVSIIEAKIQIPSRNEKKYQSTANVSANVISNTVSTTTNVQSTSATLAIISVDSKSQNIIKKDLETKPSILTLIKNESFNVLSNNKTSIIPVTSSVSSEKITSTTIHHPLMKITTTKEPLLKSSLNVKSTCVIPTTSSIKNDIYEFKEPEPFEFEARKTSSITTVTGTISGLSETEKKKKLLQKSSYELPLNHEFKSLAVSTTTAISTQQPVVVVTTTPIKKGKKSSPIKDATEKLVVQSSSATITSKLNKIDDKSEQIASTSSLLSPPTSTAAIMNTVKSTDTTFDVLRKSPSFNLNINALNEELATTVQETTKALTDVNLPKIPSLNLSVISLPSTSQQKLPQYNPPFINNKSDISNVFEMKQDTEKSSSDDDEQKTKKRKNRTHGLESVKKILLSDTGGFDLEPRKIEKPSSIADKVLKALNQKKEEEAEKIKEIDSTKISLKTNNDQSSLSIISSSCNPSTSYASINKINSPNFNIGSTSNLITNEPPKIEMPIFIKKDFENALKKPILNSPEHKLDILESIAPKNNDLTETIHKLESAILMKTTNVDHFEEDSSDSTDSERRLVIEDDESLEDNNLNDTISAPEYSPLKKSTEPQQQLPTSIICAASTSAAAVAAANTIASLSTTLTQHQQQLSSIIKSEEKLPITKLIKRSEIVGKSEDSIFTLAAVAAASKDNTIGSILPQTKPNLFGLQSTNYNQSLLSDAGVKPILDINQQSFKTTTAVTELKRSTTELQDLPLTTIKKEDILIGSTSNEIVQNLHSDSINLLLCEETIPGSPQPVTAKDIMENALSKIHLHPTESDIKPIPMDIECVGPMISSSIASGSNTTAASSAAAVSAVAAAAKLKVEQQTSSSSPHDSQSQDDSSEDLKKQLDQDIEDDGDVSPKKRRRTRKHSEVECHMKRRRGNRGMEINVKKNNGSDSDDNSDANISQRSTSSARPIRPCQYNFLVQLDSALNPNQRISILRKKITELRKTYNMIKTELASIDRRRKKLRRREREKKQQQKQQLNV